MRTENRKHETGNGKPVIVYLLTSVFRFRFPISGLLFRVFADIGEKIDTLFSREWEMARIIEQGRRRRGTAGLLTSVK